MLKYINHFSTSIQRQLFQLDRQPVGKTTLIVLVFLDVFILGAIFQGLADHTRQLTSPAEYIPTICRDIVIHRTWQQGTRVEQVADLVNSYHERGRNMAAVGALHPLCSQLATHFNEVKNSPELINLLKAVSETENALAATSQRLEQVRGAFDTSLKTVETRPGASDPVAALETRVKEQTRSINELEENRVRLYEQLRQNESFTALTTALESTSLADRDQLAAEYRKLSLWFPLKRLGMEAIFILPIIFAFWFWNTRSLKNNRPFQTLVSTHLLVVAFIPLVIKFGELVYDILPQRLLVTVLELLERLGLVAIWHYLLMAAVISMALAMIYVFQKKLFSPEREHARRITRGLCQQCASRLPGGSSACSLCGFQQFHHCDHCGDLTWVYGPFCRSCGAPQT
ncbi:MAG: zinc ribbon domain-containing protein [Proteobacteria bacterium]|nr:zinc ribbon domain-containing protein [Pseudomonadota bacterium]